MIKVFLCIMDMDLLTDMISLNLEHDIRIVGYACKVPENLNFLSELEVDAIVIRDAINFKRANILIEKLRNVKMYKHIRVVHIFKIIDGCTFHVLTQSCLQNYLLEPYTAIDVMMKVKEEVEKTDKEYNLAQFVEEVGTESLLESGIQENLKGFQYMKMAAYVIIQSKEKITMHKAYEEVANVYDTSSDCVEKAIRLAIYQGYEQHPDKFLFRNKKPTNGEVIKMMIGLLKIRGMLF